MKKVFDEEKEENKKKLSEVIETLYIAESQTFARTYENIRVGGAFGNLTPRYFSLRKSTFPLTLSHSYFSRSGCTRVKFPNALLDEIGKCVILTFSVAIDSSCNVICSS